MLTSMNVVCAVKKYCMAEESLSDHIDMNRGLSDFIRLTETRAICSFKINNQLQHFKANQSLYARLIL